MATYSLPSSGSNCCEEGVLSCPDTTCGDCGDCDEQTNKYWYEDENYEWKQYEKMFLYTLRCELCPSVAYTDPWGDLQTDCPHCDSIYAAPIELFWNLTGCAYVSSDGVHVYSLEHGHRTNWFGYANNGDVYVDPYGMNAYRDNKFLPASYMLTTWWEYYQGGSFFVLINGDGNLEGNDNSDVRCPRSTDCD